MQSVHISALYAECPYYSVIYMQSVLMMQCFICKLLIMLCFVCKLLIMLCFVCKVPGAVIGTAGGRTSRGICISSNDARHERGIAHAQPVHSHDLPYHPTHALVNCVPNTFQPSRDPSTGWYRRRRRNGGSGSEFHPSVGMADLG